MTDEPPETANRPGQVARQGRQERLAGALRANLQRRKAQARARAADPAAPAGAPGDPPAGRGAAED